MGAEEQEQFASCTDFEQRLFLGQPSMKPRLMAIMTAWVRSFA